MHIDKGGAAATVGGAADNQADAAQHLPKGAWATAWITMAVCSVSWLDRTLPQILMEPMTRELGLLDSQATLLTGLAFAVCYAFAALPVSWLADRVNRAYLLAAGVALWCSLTVCFGLAGSFVVLFLCRMGVGLGEAALAPCSVSLLSDKFPRTVLPRALAIYQLGSPVGVTLGLVGGASLTQWLMNSGAADGIGLSPWRITFVVAGAIGLLTVPLLLTVKDHRPPRPDKKHGDPERAPIFNYLWEVRGFLVPLMLGNTFFSLFLSGYPQWLGALFQREHGWTLAGTGLAAGLIGVIGVIGSIATGWITPRISQRLGRDATLDVMVVCAIIIAPLAAIGPAIPNAYLSYAVICMPLFFAFGAATLLPGAIVNAAPSWLRARFTAINVFLASLIGYGFGPVFFALLTDFVFGRENMHWSLVAGSAGIFVGLIPMWILARGRYQAAIAKADATERAAGLPSHDDHLTQVFH